MMVLLALLAGAALGQETPAPQPNPANADYHFRYLNQLDPAQGWRRTPSGLRYRQLSGTADGPRPSPTDTVTIL